jgi:DNA-binding CsgD family transcriptional regulator
MITADELKALTHNELIAVTELNYHALTVTDAGALEKIVEKLKNFIPYTYAIANVSILNQSGINIIDVMNINYPPEFLEIYFANNMQNQDPLVRTHVKRFDVQVWSETFKTNDANQVLELAGLAGEYNMRDGLVFGLPEPINSVISFFCMSGAYLKPRKRNITICKLAAPFLHQAYMQILPDKERTVMGTQSVPNLSEREKEMMKWLKEGKTNWEISVILNIGESTVKQHFRNIVRKLNASGKGHALAKALKMRIIPL